MDIIKNEAWLKGHHGRMCGTAELQALTEGTRKPTLELALLDSFFCCHQQRSLTALASKILLQCLVGHPLSGVFFKLAIRDGCRFCRFCSFVTCRMERVSQICAAIEATLFCPRECCNVGM